MVMKSDLILSLDSNIDSVPQANYYGPKMTTKMSIAGLVLEIKKKLFENYLKMISPNFRK